jgi:hypothetical protein
MTTLRSHWQLLLLAALVVALWSTPVLLPLKILVVFLHELSHLVTVLLTGGSPETLSLTPREGGAVLSRGGSRFLTLSAGYLGSLLIGLGLFLAALNSFADRLVTAFLGAVLVVVAALYIRDPFTLAFCLGAAAVMLAMARWLGHGPNDLLLRLIGLASIIYVPLDIFSDTLARSHLRSDARMLAEEFGGTTMFWGGLWLALSLVVIVFALRHGLRPAPDHRAPD